MKIIRKYQQEAVNRGIDALLEGSQIPVLALAPNAGKTFIMTKICEKLILEHGYKKIVIFSENICTLRSQNFESIKEDVNVSLHDNVVLLDSWSKIDQCLEANIIVTLPATIGSNKLPFDTDLVIIDEAHNRVESTSASEPDNQIQGIIRTNDIKKQLYATGTPAIFILNNELRRVKNEPEKYNLIIYSMLDLYHESKVLGQDWFTDTRFYTASSNIKRSELKEIYNYEGDVKKSVILTECDSVKLLNTGVGLLIERQRDAMLVNNPELVNAKDKDIVKKLFKAVKGGYKEFMGGIGKTMWACHNQELAKYVCKTLNELGVNTVLSCQEAGDNSENINRFKEDPSIKCLVVVNRGILGFNIA